MRNFEITKREVLASISIIAVMILVGILISAKITERQMDRNEVYNKAVKIDNQEMFSYGMRTNVGNAFVYGTLQAVDPVSYPEIDGSYMYVEKIKKRYTMHTRTVAQTETLHIPSRPIGVGIMLEKSQKQHRLFLSVKLLFQSPNLNYPERYTLTPYTNPVTFGMNITVSASHIQEPSLQPFLTTLSLIAAHSMKV